MIQSQDQKQTQKFSPLQIQMLNLLHLSTQELQQKIKDEIEENPALEESTDDNDTETVEVEDITEGAENSMDDYADFYDEYDDEIPQYKTKLETDYSDDIDFSMPMVQQTSFHERIKHQILMMALTVKQREIALFLTDSLDDDGYLRNDLEELQDQFAFSNDYEVSVEDFNEALACIQSCDPIGIGARNLQECLLLQLNKNKTKEPFFKLTQKILENHIFELENRNFDKIQRLLHIDGDQLRGCILLISKLSPKPNIFTDETVHYNQVIPEYSVRCENGELVVGLINKNLPDIKLSRSVVELVSEGKENRAQLKKRDKAAIGFFKSKIATAKWFIDAIKQREQTMLKTIKAIAQFQYEYFCTGDNKTLRPMILKNIAELIEMDIATISRVTSTKYVQTDFGTVLLKTLFTEALSKDNGDVVSNKEIQDIIKEILVAENKSEPLTDLQISEGLKGQGYTIARRTVAKYRECLGLPIAKMRKSIN